MKFCRFPLFCRSRALSFLTLLIIPAIAQAATEVRLNQLIYADKQTITATVSVDPGVTVTNKNLYLVSSDSKDVEIVPLEVMSEGLFAAKVGIPIAASGNVVQQDGTLTCKPGEYFFGLFYPHAYDPQLGKEAQGFAGFGLLENAAIQEPQSVVMPELAMSQDETNVPPNGKSIATLAQMGGLPVQFPLNELIVCPRDQKQLDALLAETAGKVLMDDTVPPPKGGNPVPARYFLIQVDPNKGDVTHLPQMRALLGEKQALVVSNPEMLKLYALVLQLQLKGYLVSANPRLQLMAPPSTRDGTATEPFDFINFDTSHSLDLFAKTTCGMRAAWAYLALWGKDQAEIPVAVLDMGFAPNWDFRGYNPSEPNLGIFQRDLEGGTTSAVAPPSVGASFFGPRMWHGNGVVTTLGGVLNNGWGSAGVGGQVVKPMLYKTGLRSYAFEMGTGIRMAANDGATIINISAGYPCTIVSSFGGFRICSPDGRAAFCRELTAALTGASALVCAVPIVGVIACPFVTAGAVTASTFCFSTLMLGDPRGPLEEGIQYAMSRGVTVVSIAGNEQNSESLGALVCGVISCGKQDVSAWEVVPGVMDGVICAGAADATSPFANNQYYGDRVDVWAPIGDSYWVPPTPDAVTGPDGQQRANGFNGTSAAAPFISGVIAMMQAVNPSLDPRTPGLTPDQLRIIPTRIRDILRDTATPASSLPTDPANPDVARRRNLVNVYAAVKAAAQGVVPDFAGMAYDTTLNFSETRFSNGDGRTNAYGLYNTDPTETILSLPSGGPPGGRASADVDWWDTAVPYSPDGIYEGGIVQLRQPVSAAGPVLINDSPGRLVGLSTPAEELREYAIPQLYSGSRYDFRVSGAGGKENVYKLHFSPPHWVSPGLSPDRFDVPGGNSPFSDNNALYSAVPLGEGSWPWQTLDPVIIGPSQTEGGKVISIPGLNFHNFSDQDCFSLKLPAGAEPTSCDGCTPYLVVETGPGVLIDVYGSSASGQVIRHSVPSRVVLNCAQYRGRAPLYFRLSPTEFGRVVQYDLRISWVMPSYFECNHRPLLSSGHVFPFMDDPRWQGPLGAGDPSDVRLPSSFTMDSQGRILEPQYLTFTWAKAGAFDALAKLPAGQSMRLQLLDTAGKIVSQVATADLAGPGLLAVSHEPSTELKMHVPQLAGGVYFLAVSYLKYNTPFELYPSRAALPPGVASFEDLTITGVEPGDFDGDGVFGQPDIDGLTFLLQNQKTPTAAQIAAADFNGDGKLDSTDLQNLQNALAKSTDLRSIWPNYTPPDAPGSAFDQVLDTDADGMPDWWETAYGLDSNDTKDSTLDNDGDGRTNLEEYLAGTNPNDAKSILRLDILTEAQGKARLSFTPPTGRTFSIEYSEHPQGPWYLYSDIEEQLYPQQFSATLEPSNLDESRFFRIVSPALR